MWRLSNLSRHTPTAIIENLGRFKLADIHIQGSQAVVVSEDNIGDGEGDIASYIATWDKNTEVFSCDLKEVSPHCELLFGGKDISYLQLSTKVSMLLTYPKDFYMS